MSPKHARLSATFVAAAVLSTLGLLVLLTLTFYWLRFGFWVSLSLIDSFAFVSVTRAVAITAWASDSDVLYFILAEAQLYAVLLVAAAVVFAIGMIRRRIRGVSETS